MAYYTNVNPDLLDKIPMNATRVLEIGCGDGSLGLAVKSRNPQAQYFGVELFEDVANVARLRLDGVVCGNIEVEEVFASLNCMRDNLLFDVLVFGDVLEHLLNPWNTLKSLRGIMAEHAICVACIPNVGHWSVVKQQLNGRWNYADSGLLDRTHLRFFTMETACEMFIEAGWNIVDCKPHVIWADQTREALIAFEPLITNLNLEKNKAKQDLSAFQWVIRGVNGSVQPTINVAALALKKLAGVNEARVDYPLRALNTTTTMRAVWGEGSLQIPQNFKPGVLILHRQFLNTDNLARHVERLTEVGWIIVSEIDDDPANWEGYKQNNYLAFRGVHAVTVSTRPLAQLIKKFNPNVTIFENAVFELSSPHAGNSQTNEKIRIFFGALNRQEDWRDIQDRLLPALHELRDKIQMVIVHDKAIYNSLPEELDKEFLPTLAPTEYLKTLGSCDIALLPLRDTAFNRLKSDLKLIECCSTGVVPIFSDVVYGNTYDSENFGIMLRQGENWGDAIKDLVGNKYKFSEFRDAGLAYVKSQRMHCQLLNRREEWLMMLRNNNISLEAERRERLLAIGKKSLFE